MTKFYLDFDECKKLNLSPGLALYLAALYFESPVDNRTLDEALARGLADFQGYDNFRNPKDVTITQTGVDFVESVFLNSEFKEENNKVDKYEELAKKLRELFPKGKKAGTSLMWRGSVFEVTKKLKTLEKKTGVTYTEEQALDATKRYIESFNGNYSYMQILPYFILKQVPVNGVMEERSQLLSYIENTEGDVNNEWTAELR